MLVQNKHPKILIAILMVSALMLTSCDSTITANGNLSPNTVYCNAQKTGDMIRNIINRLFKNKKSPNSETTKQNEKENATEHDGDTFVPFENREIIYMNRSDILKVTSNNTEKNVLLRWDGFTTQKNDVNNGVIPSEWLNDEVYCSMNLPSESVSDYMISVGRDNAHLLNTMTSLQTTAVAIGALYPSSGATLPDNFTVCLGKIKLFAYSKSQKKWVVVDSRPYPKGVMIYTLPWSGNSRKCNNIAYFEDHMEIPLTKNDLTGAVLHFWGMRLPVNKEDYLYYACAYEFYVKEKDAINTLTATISIDSKDADGNNILQLFSSRGLAVNNNHRVHWGHTIPNSQYVPETHGKALLSLY